MADLCVPAGKRKVTIEEIREALRKACVEAQERDPEGMQAAAASAEAAPSAKRQPAKGKARQQKASAATRPKKATPARKAGHLDPALAQNVRWREGSKSFPCSALSERACTCHICSLPCFSACRCLAA